MHGKERNHRKIRAVRGTGQPLFARHRGHFHRSKHSAHITDVRLDDIHRRHLNDSPPGRQITILLAPGDVQGQGFGYLTGLLKFPVRTRFLKMFDSTVFEQLSDRDRPFR